MQYRGACSCQTGYTIYTVGKPAHPEAPKDNLNPSPTQSAEGPTQRWLSGAYGEPLHGSWGEGDCMGRRGMGLLSN
jgi:hypothetical protein